MKLKEKAYSIIKKEIFNFELKPKEVFFETDISKKLGVSRTPIRDALNRLEQEGLISRLSNRGYSVVDITASEIEELYELREALEVMALSAAAKRAQKQDWIRLEKKLLSQTVPQQDFSKKEYERFSELAQEFDREVARLSGKATLQKMISMITDKVNRFRWMNIFFKDRAEQSRNEHLEIISYLKQDRVEEAIAATREHIHNSRDNILTLLHRKKNLLYID
ncbi:MAG TPA: GntR family transcriptional regulator [Syntrophorhabdaceae bacterium]|nr:GntR family transcriptional regulator [Syntrophorhabdaceae bacterium]